MREDSHPNSDCHVLPGRLACIALSVATAKRLQSLIVINQDHYAPIVAYAPGRYTLTREKLGTRYLMVATTAISFTSFLIAATVLAITPDLGIAYVVARTVAGGRTEGLASCIGTSIGGMLHVMAAAVGV